MFNLLSRKGNLASLELANGKTVRVPASRLPKDAKEGAPVVLASATTGSEKPSKRSTGNAGAAYDFYIKQGLAPHHAAGIVGNFMQESGRGLNPKAVGDNGTAFGIGQWRGQRYRNLRKFANDRGLQWDTLEAQLPFTIWEGQNTEQTAWKNLLASKDVYGATAAIAGYERPQGWKPGGNPENVHGWNNRYNFAQSLMDPNHVNRSISSEYRNGSPASGSNGLSVSASGMAKAGAGGTFSQRQTAKFGGSGGSKINDAKNVIADALMALGEGSSGSEKAMPPSRDYTQTQLALQEMAQSGPLPQLGEGLAIFAPTEKKLRDVL